MARDTCYNQGGGMETQPTLSDMTEFELTFAYKIEEMLSRIAHPEYRQLLVELLSIIATILERNPEVMFGSGAVDCDILIKQAFRLYADAQKIANKEDLTPFYQLENISLHTSTATYLGKGSLTRRAKMAALGAV
ncbi:hypothetical protein TELCIR_08089 [Teladorsagia circumcincta]|uniref:Phosphorylase b kinase regulatory subunit n=1 Tax=Teladorsagia circumcincta TaxID=45464 RepID=A0A2G9UIK0_TELCI|nr:hypothetical protein TELCIR_08089 [Teladorsagia circumcincta]